MEQQTMPCVRGRVTAKSKSKLRKCSLCLCNSWVVKNTNSTHHHGGRVTSTKYGAYDTDGVSTICTTAATSSAVQYDRHRMIIFVAVQIMRTTKYLFYVKASPAKRLGGIIVTTYLRDKKKVLKISTNEFDEPHLPRVQLPLTKNLHG